MKQDEFITILIPTHNRPGYLKRILAYYSEYQVACNMIVADSSPDEIKKANGEVVSSFSKIKAQYLGYPTEINPNIKIADAVERVNTKYCVFCADDDFVTPNGINQSVDFLENNTDFSVAHGRYISFHLEDDEKGEQQFCWKHTYSHESITFSYPAMRLRRHLSDYLTATFYAVHRTEILQMIWTENIKFMNDVIFGELLPSMLDLIYGKMKCLDVLYAIRTEHLVRPGYRPTLADAIKAGTYNEEYARFRECLSTHLSKQSQLEIEESRKVVDNAMSAYMKKYYYPPKSKMASLTTRLGHILDLLKLPGWLDKGIRRPYRLAELRNIKKDSLDMSSTSKYYEDFNRIRLHVLSYQNNDAPEGWF